MAIISKVSLNRELFSQCPKDWSDAKVIYFLASIEEEALESFNTTTFSKYSEAEKEAIVGDELLLHEDTFMRVTTFMNDHLENEGDEYIYKKWTLRVADFENYCEWAII